MSQPPFIRTTTAAAATTTMPTAGTARVTPHIALLASAGMGHLVPISRLAAALSACGCHVSVITAEPTVSVSESLLMSSLLASFPNIRPLLLPLAQLDPSKFPTTADPFFLRFEALLRSADALPALLDSLHISALIVDISLASTYVPVANRMNIPCYVLFTSSAAMLSLCAYFSTSESNRSDIDINIPGMWMIQNSSLPPPLRDPNHLFTAQFVANGLTLPKAAGILINTFEALEPEAIAALNSGQVVADFPRTIAIGPLRPFTRESRGCPLAWLDGQPVRSVVYVSFGSRTAMTKEQIRELGAGLEQSGCRFLWALKTMVVDRDEDDDTELEALLGQGYLERVKGRGLVVNGWVEQEEVLAHRAVGGFTSHCGWNSVTEAAMAGLRMMGWPRIGDQRVNGEVVRRSGLGVWMEEWSWEAEGGVVSGEEIGRKVSEMMANEELRLSAAKMGEEAEKAVGKDGSSVKGLEELISKFTI